MLLPNLIQTDRLTLRAPCDADASHLFDAYTQDPEVARYMVWRPHQSIGETEAFIAYCKQQWDSGQRRPYILTRRDDDAVPIGMLEARLLAGTIDIGYVLQRASWGTGLMTEALVAFADVALALPACFRVQATCDTENHASARVLEKSGFAREGRLERHMVLPNLAATPRASLMYARCK
ncbi:GNAT family N-acetyltransferase [Massilia sp. DWR3-1-1]|uniref:GNAT family N-acetyltransferase n=1 Tax=Massilia sp. DWR3-1-1 TaxID=2804559 RepID=UPI003CFA4B16